MITFKSLEASDFLSLGKVKVDYQKLGVTLVLGENLDGEGVDSNGSGKSAAAIEALVFCLFGKTLRGVEGAEVVRRGAERAEIVLTFTKGEEEYTIVRTQMLKPVAGKAGDVQLRCGGNDVSAPTNRGVQKQIEDLLGLDFDLFCQSVVLGQDSILFATASDAEKKRLLEKITGTDRFDEYRKSAGEKLHSLEAKAESVKQEIAVKLAKEASQKEQMVNLAAAEEQYEEQRQQRLKIVQSRIEDFSKVVGEKQIVMRDLEVAEIDREKANVGRKVSLEKENFAREFLSALKVAESQENSCRLRHYELKKELDAIATSCPLCKRPFDTVSLEEAKKSVEAKLLENEKDMVKCERGTSEARVRKEVADKAVEMSPKLDDWMSASVLITELQMKLADIVKAEKELERLQGEAKALLEQKSDIGARMEAVQRELELLHAQLDTHRSDLYLLSEKIPYYEFWVKGFGPKGLKSYIFDTVVGLLNRQANKYVQILTGGDVTISFKTQRELKSRESMAEEFHVEGINRFGANVYLGNSAGERQRIDLAIALALQDLARSRSSVGFNLIAFDEVFTNLDRPGQESVIRLLRSLGQSYTIFVITHQDELKEAFSQVLTVRKQGGVSGLV